MIRWRLGLKNPMTFVFFRLTSSLNETTDYDLIGASFLKRYFFTSSSILYGVQIAFIYRRSVNQWMVARRDRKFVLRVQPR
jgi:hypothetical protein